MYNPFVIKDDVLVSVKDKNINKVEIPNNVKVLGEFAFEGCKKLKVIDIPNTVEEIRKGCFLDCTNLENINLSTSLRSIPKHAFRNCFVLKEINIPGNIKTINDYAFSGCENLRKIVLNEGVEKIGISAFECCYGLSDIYLPLTLNQISFENYAFRSCFNLTVHTKNEELLSNLKKEYSFLKFIEEDTLKYSKKKDLILEKKETLNSLKEEQKI